MINVLIVDDIKLLRECMMLAIDNHSDFKVVGCASDGYVAYEMCSHLKPDVVLMDILMPLCGGIEATYKIKKDFPAIKILILTTSGQAENINKGIKNGADGYVLKDIGTEELLLAIRSVYTGLNLVNNRITKNQNNTNEAFDTNAIINKLIVVKDSEGQISAKIRSSVMDIVNAALKIQNVIDKGLLVTQDEIDEVLSRKLI